MAPVARIGVGVTPYDLWSCLRLCVMPWEGVLHEELFIIPCPAGVGRQDSPYGLLVFYCLGGSPIYFNLGVVVLYHIWDGTERLTIAGKFVNIV